MITQLSGRRTDLLSTLSGVSGLKHYDSTQDAIAKQLHGVQNVETLHINNISIQKIFSTRMLRPRAY